MSAVRIPQPQALQLSYLSLRTNLRIERQKIAARIACAGPTEAEHLRAAELTACTLLDQLLAAEVAAHAERQVAA